MHYNGLGQRIKKTVTGSNPSTELEIYDPKGRLIGVYEPDGSGGFSVKEELIYLDGFRVVATVRPDTTFGMINPQIYPIITDHLGSPRFIVSPQSTLAVWSWDAYEPFGFQAPSDMLSGTKFEYDGRFAGQRFDKETSSSHNGFRTYSPQLGRYMQSDPLGLKAGWNTYAYAGNNPVGGIDPFGLEWLRDWDDRDTEYVVGRQRSIVPPGKSVSKFIEHCVPAGRTFALKHDAEVDRLKAMGVSDLKANIPTMPRMYVEAFKEEDTKTSQEMSNWINEVMGLSRWLRGDKR